jgi:hypothetical protein
MVIVVNLVGWLSVINNCTVLLRLTTTTTTAVPVAVDYRYSILCSLSSMSTSYEHFHRPSHRRREYLATGMKHSAYVTSPAKPPPQIADSVEVDGGRIDGWRRKTLWFWSIRLRSLLLLLMTQ